MSHRLAVALTCISFVLIASGATETAVKPGFHSAAGVAALVVAGLLARSGGSRFSIYALSFAAAGGLRLLPFGPAAAQQIIHAVVSQGLLAAALVAAFETSPRWGDSAPFADGGWPSFRQLAWLTPAVTLLQITLGAAYRHKAAGLIPHVSWAFATAICVMMAGTFVLTQEGCGALLRKVSVWLLSLTGLQVLLGVGAYLARIDAAGVWGGAATMAHIATGSLVMALSCVWGAVVMRDARPAEQTESVSSRQPS